MMDHFNFPITFPHGRRTSLTYASVTGSIMKKIKEARHGEFCGRPICPPSGQFQILLKPDGCLRENYGSEKVRIQFSYPNLYVEAFCSGDNWYRFEDMNEDIVPDRASHQLPFESGYTNRGMQADFGTLRFGKNTMVDIYEVLCSYPNNPGGLAELRKALCKVSVLFSEAIRFPNLRRFLVYLMKSEDTQTVMGYSEDFQKWSTFCKVIREGREAFETDKYENTTFDDILSLVAVILHQD